MTGEAVTLSLAGDPAGGVGDALVGDALVGDALVGDALVGDALVGDALVGDAIRKAGKGAEAPEVSILAS